MMRRHALRHAPLWVRVAWAVALGMVVLFLAVLALGGQPSDEIWEDLLDRGVLRVGMDASYPPFEVVDANGDFFGYDVDLARELGRRWGVEVQFVNVHFDGLYDALQAGRCDVIISALPHDRTRTEDVSYTRAYFDAGEVLLARQGHAILTVDDLDGQRVAVELGTEGHQQMLLMVRNKGLNLDIMAVRSTDELVIVCQDESVQAIACDRITALKLLSACPDWALAQNLTTEPYVMAVVPEASVLLSELDQALEDWAAQGVMDELAVRWFGRGG